MVNNRRHIRIFFTLLCGFSLAFVLLFSAIVAIPLMGNLLEEQQLMAGAASALQNDSMRQATIAIGSFWFWTAVAGLGAVISLQIWRWFRMGE